MSKFVRESIRGAVLVVELLREEKRNAIDRDLTDGIGAALDRLEDEPALWAGVITGTPADFSAGTDLRAGMTRSARGGEYGIIRRARTKPLIAAVEGPALGGGFEIALACDLIVASRSARFGLPEVKRSLVPTCGGLFRTQRALPLNIARELMLTGEPLDAERAERLGLVNALTEPGQALAHAIALAERICASGPVAVRESMRCLTELTADADRDAWSATLRAQQAIYAADDTLEGVKAFFEKRAPRWSGR
jgi:enoyl-CoA hydratase/carnithine racemase